MPSPILARADALMQRRQHSQPASDDVPVLTDAISPDGFPLLLDAEPPEAEPEGAMELPEPSVTPAPTVEAPSPGLDAGLRDILVHELARRVEQRLVAELPRLIEATVRDFLAEQEIDGNTPPAA